MKRTANNMKRAFSPFKISIIIVLSCLLLSSCQATPEENYVVSRADETVYQNNESKVVPVENADINDTWNWKEFSYQDSFQGADGKAHVNVDLSGKYLDDPVPVLRISHHTLTPEDLKQAAEKLMPSDNYYNPAKLIEPEILQSWIDDATQRITKAKYNTDLSEEKRDKVMKNAELDLEFFTDLKKQMRYDPNAAATDWQMHYTKEGFFDHERTSIGEEGDGPKELRIRTALNENGTFGFMQAFDMTGNSFRSNELEYIKANTYASRGFCFGERDVSGDKANTSVEASKMVTEKLKELGYEMHVVAISDEGYLSFFPTYFGINYLGKQIQSEYAEEHQAEWAYAQVSGDEIYHIKWINISDVVVENDNLPLISKDDALSLFKKYMQTIYTGAHAACAGEAIPEDLLDEAQSVRIDVNRMEFGYIRIPIEEKPTEYRLVPSWVFYGQSYLEYVDGEEMPVFTDDANPGIAKGQVLMVVNAIDGSYIEAERETFV